MRSGMTIAVSVEVRCWAIDGAHGVWPRGFTPVAARCAGRPRVFAWWLPGPTVRVDGSVAVAVAEPPEHRCLTEWAHSQAPTNDWLPGWKRSTIENAIPLGDFVVITLCTNLTAADHASRRRSRQETAPLSWKGFRDPDGRPVLSCRRRRRTAS